MNEQQLKTWTVIKFSWKDRLKILLGARVQVLITTYIPQETEITDYTAIAKVRIDQHIKAWLNNDAGAAAHGKMVPVEM